MSFNGNTMEKTLKNIQSHNNTFLNIEYKNKMFRSFKNEVMILTLPILGLSCLELFKADSGKSLKGLQALKLFVLVGTLGVLSLRQKSLLSKFAYVDTLYPQPSMAQIELERQLRDKDLTSNNH